MATGKERGFKDWKGSKEFRRSARNYSESDTINRGRKKKNTRKWCKGVVGRKHLLALYSKYTFSHNYKCLKCGREFWGHLNREEFDFKEMTFEQARDEMGSDWTWKRFEEERKNYCGGMPTISGYDMLVYVLNIIKEKRIGI